MIENIAEQDVLVGRLKARHRPMTLGFCNAHSVNLTWEGSDSAKRFLDLDVILRDGKGMEILYSKAKLKPGLNLNGTDFIPLLLEACKGQRVAIYGTRDPWLTKAAKRLTAMGHDVVDTHDGFKDAAFYTDRITALQKTPEIVLLGMGMPKQEMVAHAITDALGNNPALVVCGGAIIDFISGRHPRAPWIMRRLGLEWLFRLSREPIRLFGRYVQGNTLFLYRAKVIAARLATTGQLPAQALRPTGPFLGGKDQAPLLPLKRRTI
ncbi:MAG: WecB/TagA/CpsF family glycosyltransferase [Qingshengfaniella sp.]